MADADLILGTLSTVSDRVGDPLPLIYARLFARHPDMERLFVMDRDGGVRGSMLQQAFECIIDQVGDQRAVRGIVAAERMRHEGYGAPAETFDSFFQAIRDAFRDVLGADWTPAMDREWSALLAEFAALR